MSKREETCKDVRREEGKLDCGGRREEYNNRESLARREAAADFKEPARREEYKESGAGRREESGKEGGSCRREEHKDRVTNLLNPYSSHFQRLNCHDKPNDRIVGGRIIRRQRMGAP